MWGGPARRRFAAASATRLVALFVGLAAGALVLSSCATTLPGHGVAAPGEVAAYRSEVTAARQSMAKTAGVELCREAMAAMVVMVRGYNTFVGRLNQAHNYPAVGDLDNKARASLIAGADQIRPHITGVTPADVAAPARAFLASSGRLEDGIRRELLVALNPIASGWTGDKQRLLDACAPYVPMPAATSATPRPSATPG